MLELACSVLASWLAGSTPAPFSGPELPVPPEDSSARFLEHFSTRDPFYFVMGTRGGSSARIQLSLQYDLFVPPPESEERFWHGFAIAYTQQSFWEVDKGSSQSFETVYRPSLMWHRDAVLGSADGSRWDFEFGYEHESNGRSGPLSRSVDTLYVRPTFRLPLDERWEFRTTPRVFAYIGDLSDNPDIADYRGWFDWRLQLLDARGLGLSTNLRKGGVSSFGSVQIDLTYPLNRLFGEGFDLYAHLQYFNGWGESLLSYDEKPPAQLRLGIAFVR
ncbi:MAG: phospholipase A [Planctomycetes bacterium]|nr:phospholipase A [Planctomycetota bacterium]